LTISFLDQGESSGL